MSSPTREPARTEQISDDPKDFLTGASSETVNPTQGGTAKDGSVNVFGPSKVGTDNAEQSEQQQASE